MRSPRWTLRGLMVAVLIAAIGFIALRVAPELLSFILPAMAIFLPMAGLASASRKDILARAFMSGFALGTWAFLFLCISRSGSVFMVPDLPTNSWLERLFEVIGPEPAPPPGDTLYRHGPPEYLAFQAIGHTLLALLIGLMAGLSLRCAFALRRRP